MTPVLAQYINTLMEQWEDWDKGEIASRPGLAYYLAQKLIDDGVVA